uniref:Uncharacterized protein n=1 Tax=Rhizophora mucronata TaxID=61149 RepID=A0A2P2PJD9_RHIMU
MLSMCFRALRNKFSILETGVLHYSAIMLLLIRGIHKLGSILLLL